MDGISYSTGYMLAFVGIYNSDSVDLIKLCIPAPRTLGHARTLIRRFFHIPHDATMRIVYGGKEIRNKLVRTKSHDAKLHCFIIPSHRLQSTPPMSADGPTRHKHARRYSH